MQIFEIVPNISEGGRAEVVDACVRSVENAGARVIHRTSDVVHNRSVITAVGSAAAVCDAGVALAGAALENIDLRAHRGVHPRIGALDVLPFVPLSEATMQQAVDLARECARRIWETHHIPSFFYAEAAATALRRSLAHVRSGQFEGLDTRFERPEWRPDVGDPRAHSSAGAIAIGARQILIAFNIELATGDLSVAKRLARAIRESNGGFRTLKALGLPLGEDVVQVSLNITDYCATPLARVVETVRVLARDAGTEIRRCELIGCIPLAAVKRAASFYLGAQIATIEKDIAT